MKDFVDFLKKNDLVVACAESFTGGMVASAIVSVPGASRVFENGYVVYSKKAKSETLGIDMKILDECGCVSRECAALMAKNAALKSGADIGLSTTGVAGPKEDEGKPVGDVYLGVYYHDNVYVTNQRLSGSREEIRSAAVRLLEDFALSFVEEAYIAEGSIG